MTDTRSSGEGHEEVFAKLREWRNRVMEKDSEGDTEKCKKKEGF